MQDPDELYDLGSDPDHADIRIQMETILRSICDPEAVDNLAKADQWRLLTPTVVSKLLLLKADLAQHLHPVLLQTSQIENNLVGSTVD